jgi:hypothetical protein
MKKMTKEVLTKDELLSSIDEAVSQLADLLSFLDDTEINTIPYKDSWTAGQLLRHVTKSITGMAKAMLAESKPAGRGSSEKVHQLKKTFLDFLHKMKSPEFIIPEEEIYKKQTSIEELNLSLKKLKENVNNTNLNDLVEGLPLGPTTKLELLHFVLYHTERHLHQMRKICAAVKK